MLGAHYWLKYTVYDSRTILGVHSELLRRSEFGDLPLRPRCSTLRPIPSSQSCMKGLAKQLHIADLLTPVAWPIILGRNSSHTKMQPCIETPQPNSEQT